MINFQGHSAVDVLDLLLPHTQDVTVGDSGVFVWSTIWLADKCYGYGSGNKVNKLI